MANKMQIKKFLENKRNESLEKLEKESKEKQEQAKDIFFETYKDKFIDIKNKLIYLSADYDELVKTITDSGLATFKDRCGSPTYYFNNVIDRISIRNIREYCINILEAEKIKNSYEIKISECEREYDNLIALCGANNAKDGIIILENLGFDTSLIETKKESTALITNIDANKLFV